MDEKEQEASLTAMSWIGGVLVIAAVLAFFYFST
jgi:hypothetical protein